MTHPLDRSDEPAPAGGDALFRALFEQSPLSVQVLDPDGNTIAVNRAWERLWGVSLADIPGYNVRTDPQLEANGVLAALDNAFLGEAVVLPVVAYVPDRGEYRGATRWVRAVAAPVLDEGGSVASVVLIHDDVTATVQATERLQRFGELLEETQRSARVGAWEWDVRTGALTWTDELYRLYGLEPGSPLDFERFVSLVHPDDRGPVAAAVERAAADGQPFAFDHRVVRADGSVRTMHGRGRVVLGEDGSPVRMIGTGQDITERADLEASRERLLAVQQALADAGRAFAETQADVTALLETVARHASAAVGDGCAIWLLGAEADRLSYAASHHPDPEVHEATRRHMAGMAYEPDAGMVGRVARTGAPVLLPVLDPAELRERVNPAFREHLARFPAYGLLAVPMRARGRVVGVVSVSRGGPDRPYAADDLALLQELADRAALAVENARLYEAARVAEADFRALFHGTTDAVVVTDSAGRYLEANPATEELIGFTLAEMRARQAAGGTIAAMDPAWTATAWQRLRDEGSWFGELTLHARDGSTVPVEASVSAVERPSGRVYVGIWRDATARQAHERLRRDFLAMVTHDLRSPLTALRAHAQLLQRRGEYREASVAALIAQTDRMARLIDDLADLVRLEDGQLEIRRAPVDLLDLARREAEEARVQDPARQIAVSGPDAPVTGYWDEDRLSQVLQNLLGNALAHAEGAIDVSVEVRGGEALLTVRDEGRGIAPAHVPHLFERFYRAGATGAGGLGLGLYISRMLVEAHGGRIWAESEPGRGSVFGVALPLTI